MDQKNSEYGHFSCDVNELQVHKICMQLLSNDKISSILYCKSTGKFVIRHMACLF